MAEEKNEYKKVVTVMNAGKPAYFGIDEQGKQHKLSPQEAEAHFEKERAKAKETVKNFESVEVLPGQLKPVYVAKEQNGKTRLMTNYEIEAYQQMQAGKEAKETGSVPPQAKTEPKKEETVQKAQIVQDAPQAGSVPPQVKKEEKDSPTIVGYDPKTKDPVLKDVETGKLRRATAEEKKIISENKITLGQKVEAPKKETATLKMEQAPAAPTTSTAKAFTAEALKPASISDSILQTNLNKKLDIKIEVPTPEPKKEKKNLLNKVKDVFRKKTPEEKAAKAEAKAEKEEAKKQKKIEKAEAKFEKAVEKAEKKLAKDPDNPEAQAKYATALEKAENKRDKKLEKLGALKDEFVPVEEPKAQVAPAATPTQEQQQLKEGQFRDVYGNIRDGSTPQMSDDSSRSQGASQQSDRKFNSPEEELFTVLLEAMMRYYMGPEYGYIGDRMSMRDDMTNARIDQRSNEAQLQNQQTLSQENILQSEQAKDITEAGSAGVRYAPEQVQPTYEAGSAGARYAPEPTPQPQQAGPTIEVGSVPPVVKEESTVDRTPLTDKQQKSFDSWMKTARISEEDKNQLIEKYGPKQAYNIVQKCMAEPKNVMDTAGEPFRKSKQSIEYFANLDLSKPENKAKADKVIAMDPPKLNMALMQQTQRR